jgi:hypothetical protein
MRGLLGPLALGLLAATSFAQESQQDIADRIVREQQDLRRRQVEKVMSAPARAIDHGMRDPATDPPPPPPVRLPPAREVSGLPNWLVVTLVALGVLLLGNWIRRRFAQR